MQQISDADNATPCTLTGGGQAQQAAALALAQAFGSGGSQASAFAAAVAQAIASNGCGAIEPTLARAPPSFAVVSA